MHNTLYVFGPTGCGKTSCIKQLAARLNYPVFEVTGHGRLEFADLTGHLAVKDSNMVYEYGPLALAMRDFCLNTAETLWANKQAVKSGQLDVNSMAHASGFHALCGYCD